MALEIIGVGEGSSARETAIRVAAGAIAKKWLKEKYKIEIKACLTQLGEKRYTFC